MAPKIGPYIAGDIYVESYGGSAAMLFFRERSRYEIYNDLSDLAWNFMTVFRDRSGELVRKIRYTPWGANEHELCFQWHDDPLERARRFYFRCWSSIRPFDEKSPGFRRQKKLSGGMTPAVKAFARVEHLPILADRLRGVVLENRPALEIIEDYDSPQTIHFVDPPFLGDVRANEGQDLYDVEMKDEESHRELAEALNVAKGAIVLCGYKSKLYTELYEANGWDRRDLKVRVNGGGESVESLWINKAHPLHLRNGRLL